MLQQFQWHIQTNGPKRRTPVPPGSINLGGPIATAGGLKEYANGGKIVIMRMEKGQPAAYSFNYKDVINRKNMKQNIELAPGDTVIVP